MQHLRKGRIFGRKADTRRALMKSLASSFFIRGKIRTSEQKAKELRPYAEKIITRAKMPTVANRRLLRRVFSEAVTDAIIKRAGDCKDRNGGYTRITKIGARISDGARMAIIEFIS